MSEPLRVLSLGAGVQSSAVLLMSLAGELEPLHAAVFADTGGEPAAVYSHLAWLAGQAEDAGLPLLVVREGDGLEAAEREPDRHGFNQVPYHVVRPGQRARMTRRQCTTHFKLAPIRRAVKELAAGRPVEQWIGISLDEVHRMRDSGVAWVTNRYPLVEARITRHDCLLWMERAGHPRPPRSACYFCPMHNTADWRDLRDNHPEAWAAALAYDEGLRAGAFPSRGLESPRFLHYSGRPLAEVDLSTPGEHGQLDLFGQECLGMCGV